MFNFSANHLIFVSSNDYEKARVNVFKDGDTNRCYKIYDYKKAFSFERDKKYIVSGKINSVDKMYLILENAKEDIRYSNVKVQETLMRIRA